MNYGYIRVSTDHQTTLNQEFEIVKFCKKENIAIDGWIRETISGTRSFGKRKLGKLIERAGRGDLIICTELSRLGRSLFMIMEILSLCMHKECRVWTIKEGYRLGDDIQSKVLAFAFGLSAEIERDLISQRTKEALKRKRAEGMRLGRPAGSTNKQHKLDSSREEVHQLLSRGMNRTQVAKALGVSRKTLYSWLKRGDGNV